MNFPPGSEDNAKKINDLAEDVMMKLVDADCSPRDIMYIVLLILSNTWVMFGTEKEHDERMANRFKADLMNAVKFIRKNKANTNADVN